MVLCKRKNYDSKNSFQPGYLRASHVVPWFPLEDGIPKSTRRRKITGKHGKASVTDESVEDVDEKNWRVFQMEVYIDF